VLKKKKMVENDDDHPRMMNDVAELVRMLFHHSGLSRLAILPENP
jgi:hypothetical protein